MQNRTEKQIISFKIKNWLFNYIWCYLFIVSIEKMTFFNKQLHRFIISLKFCLELRFRFFFLLLLLHHFLVVVNHWILLFNQLLVFYHILAPNNFSYSSYFSNRLLHNSVAASYTFSFPFFLLNFVGFISLIFFFKSP